MPAKFPLIDLYHEDIGQYPNTHDRRKVRRYWFRACVETLSERQLTPIRYPKRKPQPSHVEQCQACWRTFTDDDIITVYNYLLPYFKRPENRDDNCDVAALEDDENGLEDGQ